MSDRSALLAAIIAHPDDDTPRLMYADWLDEHLPDKTPSPAAGPSARAEYVRVECRLARFPFDDPDYPELLERREDLAGWLNAHTPAEDERPDVPASFEWEGDFGGEDRSYDRGFPWEVEFFEYDSDPEENIATVTRDLPAAFASSTVRALRLEEVSGSEVEGIVAHPCAGGLRGIEIDNLLDETEPEVVHALAASRRLTNLRHLRLGIPLEAGELEQLAKARLPALESLALDCVISADLKALRAARWLPTLRALHLVLESGGAFESLADLPPMPNLVALTIVLAPAPAAGAVRRFATSASFPRLARLELYHARLDPAQIEALAAGEWPLRHLKLWHVPVRKAGAEALAGAAFAGTLRVLELPACQITAGGIQALAASARLAGLKHLNLSENPVGTGGLLALVRSEHLRGLRSLALDRCDASKAPLDAAALVNFLSALELPELRHLNLDHLPVRVRGARALAAGESFANLTRLSLAECGLGEKGTRAIVESPVLANLAALDLRGNAAGTGAAALANPMVFPRLGLADVSNNRIPKGPLARLRNRPGVQV